MAWLFLALIDSQKKQIIKQVKTSGNAPIKTCLVIISFLRADRYGNRFILIIGVTLQACGLPTRPRLRQLRPYPACIRNRMSFYRT